MEDDFDRAMDLAKAKREDDLVERYYYRNNRAAFKEKEKQQARIYMSIIRHGKDVQMAMAERKGIIVKRRTKQTPDWIVLQLGIKVKDLQPNELGYVNVDICKSKDGSYFYPKIDNWKPAKKEENITNVNEIDIDGVPF